MINRGQGESKEAQSHPVRASGLVEGPASTRRAFELDGFREALAKEAGRQGMRKVVLGEPGGEALEVWEKEGWSPTAKRILVSSGVHGDEPAGCLGMLEWLRTEWLPEAFAWTLLPAANPSGLRLGTRHNAAGVDLNRDFRRVRTEEVRLLRAHLAGLAGGIHLHLSLHEDWETSGFYCYQINTSGHPACARTVLQAAGDEMPLEQSLWVDGHRLSEPGLIHHEAIPDEPEGWPEAIWVARTFAALSFTFETPSTHHLEARVRTHAAALRAAVACYLREQVREIWRQPALELGQAG